MNGFLIFANGTVEEIDPEGDTVTYWRAPGLYDDLVLAGYPLHADDSKTFDGCLDLLVDHGEVVAHTSGQAPHEHRMGASSEMFLSWHRAAVSEEER